MNKLIKKIRQQLRDHPIRSLLVVVLGFNALLNIYYFAYTVINSDHVAFFFLFDELFKGRTYFPPDNFIVKYPYYSIYKAIFGYSRGLLVAINMTNLIFLFSLVILVYLTLIKDRLKNKNSMLLLLPLFLLVNLSDYFFEFLSHPFLRNAEIGLMFLVILWQIQGRYTRPVWYALGLVTLFLLLFSDTYFIYVFSIPLLLSLLVLYIKNGSLTKSELHFGLMVVLASLSSLLLVELINSTELALILTIKGHWLFFDQIGHNLAIFAEGLLYLFDAYFFGEAVYSTYSIAAVLNLVLLMLGVFGLYRMLRAGIRKGNLWRIYLPLAFAVTILSYVSSNLVKNLSNTRYIILAPFLLLFGWQYLFLRITDKQKSLQVVFYSIFALAIPLNIWMVYPQLSSIPSSQEQYADYYTLIEALEEEGLEYGYTDYWYASTTTFLAENRIRLRQVISSYEAGKVIPYAWVSNSIWYKPDYYSGRTFLLLPKETLDRDDFRQKVLLQFGEPRKSTIIETSSEEFELIIYDFNIAERW